MLCEKCLSTFGGGEDWWLWWNICCDDGFGLLDLLSLDDNWCVGGFFFLGASDLDDGRNGSSVLPLLVDAQDLAKEASSATKSVIGTRARGDGSNTFLSCR